MKHKKDLVVDVRPDIRSGREPFARIMQAVAALRDGQDLVLLAPFEPVPLFGLLRQRGFSHTAKALPDGDWEIRFARATEASDSPTAVGVPGTPAIPGAEPAVVSVDARGLEPPQPLVKILEALASLPRDTALRAHTDRRPMHLYAQLEERGFIAETEEQPDGSFVTYVTRR